MPARIHEVHSDAAVVVGAEEQEVRARLPVLHLVRVGHREDSFTARSGQWYQPRKRRAEGLGIATFRPVQRDRNQAVVRSEQASSVGRSSSVPSG